MPGTIHGALGVADDEQAQVGALDQLTLFDATAQVLGDHNDEMEQAEAFFIERNTEEHTIVYKLEGGGYLEETGTKSEPSEMRAGGEWKVQFPLKNLAAAIGWDWVAIAYMTLAEFERHLRGVYKADINTRRREILRSLLNNANRTVKDPFAKQITVKPLANGDGDLYPPIVGADVPATSNHYLGSASDSRAFTDVNNPIPRQVALLEQHFGSMSGGSPIVTIVNPAQTPYVQALQGFNPYPSRFVAYGDNVSLAKAELFPNGLPPGKVVGECDESIIVEWGWWPAGYIYSGHCEAPAPLLRRVDKAVSGLAPGLQLRNKTSAGGALEGAFWSNRFGLGAGNRLNGVITDLQNSTYQTPAAYAG